MHLNQLNMSIIKSYIPEKLLPLFIISVSILFPRPTIAMCAAQPQDPGFERQRSDRVSAPWIAEGRAGIDIGRKLSHSGPNNAWARNNSGWNAIRQPITLSAGDSYDVTAFIRTSPNVRDGYFGFRDANQRPVAEIKFGQLNNYQQLKVLFRPAKTGKYHIFAGFWAPNEDAWIQIDDTHVAYPCRDTE